MIRCLKSVQIRSFFGSVFSCIWTEYIEILRISPYSVRMWENTYQKNSVFGHFSHSDCIPVVFGLNSENKGVWIELQIVLFMFFYFISLAMFSLCIVKLSTQCHETKPKVQKLHKTVSGIGFSKKFEIFNILHLTSK